MMGGPGYELMLDVECVMEIDNAWNCTGEHLESISTESTEVKEQ